MTKEHVSNVCTTISVIFDRAKKFDLSASQNLTLLAVYSAKKATYSAIAQASTLSTHTLRGKASPLDYLEAEGLIESHKKRNKNGKLEKVYTCNSTGDQVVRTIITGKGDA